MFLDGDLSAILQIFLIITLIVIFSIAIPVFGYKRKKAKGLAWGCIIQPIICFVAILLVGVGICFYETQTIKDARKAAMVTLRSVEVRPIGETIFLWYLKPDEECFMEFFPVSKEKEKDNNFIEVFVDKNREEERSEEGRKYYDVIRLDSASLGVEDRIVVHFDFKNRKVTATDDGKPIQVTQVDWEKAKAFFDK